MLCATAQIRLPSSKKKMAASKIHFDLMTVRSWPTRRMRPHCVTTGSACWQTGSRTQCRLTKVGSNGPGDLVECLKVGNNNGDGGSDNRLVERKHLGRYLAPGPRVGRNNSQRRQA